MTEQTTTQPTVFGRVVEEFMSERGVSRDDLRDDLGADFLGAIERRMYRNRWEPVGDLEPLALHLGLDDQEMMRLALASAYEVEEV
jgi:hypothetical protein